MSARRGDCFAAFVLATIATAGLLVFAFPSHGSPSTHDLTDHAGESAEGHHSSGEIHVADLTSYADIKDMATLNIAGSFLGQENVRNAIVRSLTGKNGPLLLRPIVDMLCAAIQQLQDEDSSASAGQDEVIGTECATDATVKTIQEAIGHLNFGSLAENPFAAFDVLDKVFHAVAPISHDEDQDSTSTSGYHGEAKLSELAAKKFSAILGRVGVHSEFIDGLKTIFEAGKEKLAAMDDRAQVPQGVSLLQGYLRLFLSDRDLEKAFFQAACDDHAIHSNLAAYFATKYGLVTKHQAEETIHDVIRAILRNWGSRDTVFSLMKAAYAKLTGKNLPISFEFYDGLVQGVKNGDIDLGAILGYMEMAQVNPALLKVLEDYDVKAYGRIKHLYVPAYMFIRGYFQEHPASKINT